MKKILRSLGIMLLLIMGFGALPVYAAESASVVLQEEKTDRESNTIQISCQMSQLNGVSNGKIRIGYDGEKVKLTENTAGDLLKDALYETNDCLTGNKAEGEIVYAFASANAIPTEGCFAQLKFQLTDQVTDGENIRFTVSVEKLAGTEGDVSVEYSNLTVKVPTKQSDSIQDPADKSDDKENGQNIEKNNTQDTTTTEKSQESVKKGSTNSGKKITGGSTSVISKKADSTKKGTTTGGSTEEEKETASEESASGEELETSQGEQTETLTTEDKQKDTQSDKEEKTQEKSEKEKSAYEKILLILLVLIVIIEGIIICKKRK